MSSRNSPRTVDLSDIAEIVCGGTPSTSIPEYWTPEIDWVTAKDVSECDLMKISKTARLISLQGLENSSAKMLPALATVLIARGATMGKCRMIARPMALNQTCYGIIAKEGTDPKFLFYQLLGLYDHFRAVAHGTVFDTVIGSGLRSLKVSLPELPQQRQVALMLGALDDKIDLNHQMNETLESMARAIFKSWFVDFDPVRARAEGRQPFGMNADTAALFPNAFEDSPIGKIPDGWRASTVGGHMFNFDSRRVPVSSRERLKRRGPFPYHGAAGVMDHVDDYLFDGTYLLVGEDGSVANDKGLAVTQYVWGKFWVNNHAHVLQGKDPVSTEQLYLYFQFEPVTPYVTGAVQPKLSQGRMNMMPFISAGPGPCSAFTNITQALFAKVREGTDENKTLTALRDLLRPKLISGEIRVRDAEKIVEEHV